MSTSCTSAAAATASSSSLAAHGSASALYASIATLHSADDADARSGEDDEPNELHSAEQGCSMLYQGKNKDSGGDETRKNKRKNFKPRNIRPSGGEEGDDEEYLMDDDDEEVVGSNEDSPAEDSGSSKEAQSKSEPHPLDLSEAMRSRRNDVSQWDDNDSRSSSNCSRPGFRTAAVDLSIIRPSTTASSDEEEDEDEARRSDSSPEESSMAASTLKMRTWMLLLQQQLQQQQQQQQQSGQPSEQSSSSSSSLARPGGAMDVTAMKEYAETTMRELLGLYGIPRETAAQFIAQQMPRGNALASSFATTTASSTGRAGSPFHSVSGMASAPNPSGSGGGHQPPTPPHTPKTGGGVTNGHLSTPGSSLLGRFSDSSGSQGSEPSLVALQAHIQSVLRTSSGTPMEPTACDQQIGRGIFPSDRVPFVGLSYQLEAKLKSPDTMAPSTCQQGVGGRNDSSVPIQIPSSGSGRTSKATGGLGVVGSGRGTGNGGSNKNNAAPIDYSRYVKRFANALECGSPYCKDLNYREHFHCLDCNSRVFLKKEEMIRHFKWHKKRDESLQHGFMRYSPGDDCNDRYRGCPHNRKQTHYHCVKSTCDKVYISTSDVQMHANYHRKDSMIMQEGFQRFRATEDCSTAHCPFNGQRTTHFHCIRAPCNYTFKNKADMEKHKSYHVKDEQLTRDGFKKFMKNEECQFDGCRFSRVCNHIHCIRQGCTYVLHSSGQLYSHKRKHERRDAELASQGSNANAGNSVAPIGSTDSNSSSSFNAQPPSQPGSNAPGEIQQPQQHPNPLSLAASSDFSRLLSDPSLAALLYGRIPSVLSQLEAAHRHQQQQQQEAEKEQRAKVASLQMERQSRLLRSPSPVMSEEDAFRLYLARVEAGKHCRHPGCQIHPLEHYHCRSDGCNLAFKSTESAKEHWRNHEQQEHVTDAYYISVDVDEEPNPCPPGCPHQTRLRHYHCLSEGCAEIILGTDKPFRRLDHYKMHEYSRKNQAATPQPTTPLPTPASSMSLHQAGFSREINTSAFSLDSMFRRKRGRPPKNRVIEVWNESSLTSPGPDTPQAIFTSFKLPKPTTPPLMQLPGPPTQAGGSLFTPPYPISSLAQQHHLSSPSLTMSQSLVSVSSSSSRSSKGQRTPSPSPERLERLRRTSDKTSPTRQRNGSPNLPVPPSPLRSPESPTKTGSITVVKAAGTFYPIAAFPSSKSDCGPVALPPPSLPAASSSTSPPPAAHQSSSSSSLSSTSSPASSASSPAAAAATAAALITDKPVAYGPEQSCGRPFCKLKRREHYHCVVCNQAFSEIDRLKPHMVKHCTGALSPTMSQWASHCASSMATQSATSSTGDVKEEPVDRQDNREEESSRLSATGTFSTIEADAARSSAAALHALSTFMPYGLIPQSGSNPGAFLPPGFQSIYAHPNLLMPNAMVGFRPPGSPTSGPKRPSHSPIDQLSMSPDAKKMRFQSSMRILKDEPVPDGYVRFRFNEDCQYGHCGYREHQTHFHCMRQDCGYSFCDKTRFVQHTARHERLDTLMGGDFQQYRANVGCGRAGCIYTASLGAVQNKASHFHCLKCDFVCTDTNKVVAHRRQHQKTDSIMQAGFEKFTPSQNCRVDSCPHSNKQTHYHCLKCFYAVLGLAQMSAHKYRHLESSSATNSS